MFRKNNSNLQERLFDDFQHLHPSQQKRLMASWALIFYEHVFSQIDEAPFAPLYSADNGRPNFPINILLSLEFYKHWQDLTDEQLLEQASFNYQVMYAIGLRNLGEEYVAPRTLYDFRSRVHRHMLDNPESGDLIFGQFNNLTTHFIEETGAKTDEQRTDSSFVTANIQRMYRVGLIFDVLFHAIESCPETFLTDELKEVLKPTFKTNVLYRTRPSTAQERIESLLNLGQQLLDIKKANQEIADCKTFDLLERLLKEQGIWNEEQQKWDAKLSKNISPDSLQSAHDPDATYRHKGNRDSVGYVANITETCSKENQAQFVTDYTIEPNTTTDVDMLNDRLPDIKKRTGVEKMYTDGGYYSETVDQTAKQTEVEMLYSSLTGKEPNPDRIPYTAFEIEDRQIIKACPEQHKAQRATFNEKDKTLSAHFDLETCRNCPHLEQCPVKLQKKDAVVRVSQKTILADETRQKLANGGQQENTSRRTAIEGTNSALKRSQGLGKLAVRGKHKVSAVVGLKIIGHNFQQFITYLARKTKETIKQVATSFPTTPPQGVSLSF
ncbi:hypothetical protein SPACI_023980 [Sporomusa acidovorans DSM 3132]|uniref:Transposase DDE domain protein n=1 Tax=Sporomusa acidovorans (strain ATCC 49682 / DSM 3132 / Mol) TaxID=1123286 RepID=A0ABZ3J2Q9_SPOA4